VISFFLARSFCTAPSLSPSLARPSASLSVRRCVLAALLATQNPPPTASSAHCLFDMHNVTDTLSALLWDRRQQGDMSTISLALDILLNGALLIWARLTPPLPGVLRFVRPFTCAVIRELTTQLPLLCRIAAFLMAAPFALCIALDIVAYGKFLLFRVRRFS
jgi:hypothetical protein